MALFNNHMMRTTEGRGSKASVLIKPFFITVPEIVYSFKPCEILFFRCGVHPAVTRVISGAILNVNMFPFYFDGILMIYSKCYDVITLSITTHLLFSP